MTTTMFLMSGSRSVPAGMLGSGRSPGPMVVVDGLVDGVVGALDEDEDEEVEHAPNPKAAAPATAPPSSALREKADDPSMLRP